MVIPNHDPVKTSIRTVDKFDLAIKGGEVLDPSQSLRAKRDIELEEGSAMLQPSEVGDVSF